MPTGTDQEPTSPPTTTEIITLQLGDRVYELVPILKPGEDTISGNEMVERAEAMNANLGEEDGRYIIHYCREIPAALQQFGMVFTGWRSPSLSRHAAYFYWQDGLWFKHWVFLGCPWGGSKRVVRRIK